MIEQVGILAALVVPRLVGRSEDARIAKAKGDLATFRNQLAAYEVDNGRFPTTDQGLDALVEKPTIEPVPPRYNPDGYLEKPVDPDRLFKLLEEVT